MEEFDQSPKQGRKRRYGLLVFLWAFGATSALLGLALIAGANVRSVRDSIDVRWIWGGVAVCFVATLAVGIRLYVRSRFDTIRIASEVLALIVLPLWGLAMDFASDDCAACDLARPLASPDVLGVYVVYTAALVAYAVARRRPSRLRPWAEAWLVALLGAGIAVCSILPFQWFVVIPLALVVPWAGPPLIAPFIAVWLFSSTLIARLRRHGLGLDRAVVRTSALAAVVLGLWSVLQRLTFGRWPSAVLTETCGWTFSMLEKASSCGGQHYLCTVAARGHWWLVRPERIGYRAGQAILVNRQLAVANAFEDLLHTRWPRFGRRCRLLYDYFALPISRHIRHPLCCDLVYLLMKPFELGFGLLLLLFDPSDPEERIGRMYRAEPMPHRSGE